MGRAYRSLLRVAIATMARALAPNPNPNPKPNPNPDPNPTPNPKQARALAEDKSEPEIGPREVQLMEVALRQYHDHLG